MSHATSRRPGRARLACATLLALLATAPAAASPAGVSSWSHGGHTYYTRDLRSVTTGQEVAGTTVLDLEGLLTSFGLDAHRVAMARDFRLNEARSGYGGWVTLDQHAGEIPVHNGRIILHANDAGSVDYLEWRGIDNPVIGTHTSELRAENFSAALAALDADVISVAGITPIYTLRNESLVPAWSARVLWRSSRATEDAQEPRFESVVLTAAGTLLRRHPLTGNAAPNCPWTTGCAQIEADYEFGVPQIGQHEAKDYNALLSIHRTVIRMPVRLAPNSGTAVIPLNNDPGPLHWDESDLDLQDTIIRREGEPPSGNATVDFVFEQLGTVYDALLTLFDWRSMDDRNVPLLAVIGSERNPTFFSQYHPLNKITLNNHAISSNTQASDRDVIHHEFMHGVIFHTAQFSFAFTPGRNLSESGAINESYADILTAVVDAERAPSGTKPGTWTIGEYSGIDRSMDDPRASANAGVDFFGQLVDCPPSAFVCPDHANGGVSSLAFKLLVEGGTHPHGTGSLTVDGLGWERARDVFFDVLQNRMASSDETFADLRIHTAEAAVQRFGANSPELVSVCKAWDAVGVPGKGQLHCAVVPDVVTNVSVAETCRGDNDVDWSPAARATQYRAFAALNVGGYGLLPAFYTGASEHTTYTVTHPGVQHRRYIYVQACNAVTCGPMSTSYGVAEHQQTTCQ